MKKNKLLIIDPQNDFCSPKGALYVKNAEKDMDRLKQFIQKHIMKINEIHITKDTHQKYDIAHPSYWKNNKDEHPEPFTIITFEDFKKGKYTPVDSKEYAWVKFYLINIEKNKKQPLCIWPEHCAKQEGWNLYEPIEYIYKTNIENSNIDIIEHLKGYFYRSEHFSAIDAEVPFLQENRKKTKEGYVSYEENITRNNILINNLQNEDTNKLLIAGEASSHCLGATVKDIIEDPEININLNKVYILKDATSPVEGFESQEQKYFNYFKKHNINIVNIEEMEKILNE
ncbi:MAG: hypothetical protein ACOCP8_03950 [archaeon]